ncbi:Arylsulfatase A [Mariniphaga anaerophila]|uniref:Arylsulfatase A n=1 Tax=Mariniphaga anaerophila TaxID=1484053 RepID=A0A1M4WMP1_9BACT|nr:sulfatase [Mariniphaga anaerophila]SHE82242.1 Arylsulfatase A [Mariniphaga anaerophila]
MKLLLFITLLFPNAFFSDNQPTTIQEKPNILWLTLEDTSPHQFGCYGSPDVKTPEVDALAGKGIRYTNASSNAPHCSAARSTLITGCYATTYGMDIHREQYETPEDIFYPLYLRKAGYFCTNNAKTDYNSTIDDKSLWDECSHEASYNSPARKPGQPFFAIFNTTATHMGLVRTITTEGRPDFKKFGIDENKIFLPPHVPDLPEMRSDEAYELKASQESSQWAQVFLDDLEKRGLAENTIVFFYSDHGGCLPRGKGFPYESGLRVPLIIYVPPAWQEKLGVESGIVDPRLVSFVDFAPTILSLAGVEPPDFMQGKAFMGKYAEAPRKLQFGFRANQENYHYDPCRTVTDGRYKYIRNYIPHKPFCLRNLYQWGMPANLAWDEYVMSGKCTRPEWLQPFQPKSAEMLFDLENDPWELNNLAGDSEYNNELQFFRKETAKHIRESNDLGLFVRGLRKKPGGLYRWVKEENFPLEKLYEAAELASSPTAADTEKLVELLQSPYPEFRYWGAIGFCTLGSQKQTGECPEELIQAANDKTKEVATAAAEALCYLGEFDKGVKKLIHLFENNFNLAYSSLETLTWYPEQRQMMMKYLPEFISMNKKQEQIVQDRMGLGVKVRSILVNLGELPLSELYTEEDREKGIEANKKGRTFVYPPDIQPSVHQ